MTQMAWGVAPGHSGARLGAVSVTGMLFRPMTVQYADATRGALLSIALRTASSSWS